MPLAYSSGARSDRQIPSLLPEFQGKTLDPEAFMEIIVKVYEKKIYNYAYRMTGCPEDAEDLTQETFFRAYRSLRSFRGECSVSTWIFRIAANLCTDQYRRNRKRPLCIDSPVLYEDDRLKYEIPDKSPSPADIAENIELRNAIMGAIERLPEEQKKVVLLRDVYGLKYEEVAFCLGIPVGTVKSRLNRARLLLRTYLAGLITPEELNPKPENRPPSNDLPLLDGTRDKFLNSLEERQRKGRNIINNVTGQRSLRLAEA
ncbi:MAG TPA: sigma-70 family RNA polymerase sigma factor [Clostridia bacterium]|nr:sigma-70 family RNA polymerase sigma factor [Clostridia bacterium]